MHTQEQDNDFLELKVEDSGCGIEDEVVEKAFQLFNNLGERQQVNNHGIGLGLTIISKVLNALHGTVNIRCGNGKGTLFSVTIPIQVNNKIEIVHEDGSNRQDTSELGATSPGLKPHVFMN
mmetsp:Transcript_10183/g.10162  ORF Transcript_10183/g.10162 Transcript_10183/m.10162 type:complete len:121 (+) Transcript_10183:1429-1791(+)